MRLARLAAKEDFDAGGMSATALHRAKPSSRQTPVNARKQLRARRCLPLRQVAGAAEEVPLPAGAAPEIRNFEYI